MKMKRNCEGCEYKGNEDVCRQCVLQSNPIEAFKPKRQPKYRNRVFERNGEEYRSEKEYNRHMTLIHKVHFSEISNLQREVVYELIPSVILNGRKKPPIRYIADFVYFQNGREVVEDVKSPITKKNPVYRLKKHLLKWKYDIDIREV